MLKRKLWRDLKHHKMQFFSIFLMAFLGILVFVGLDAEGNGTEQSGNSFYEETNLADIWVRGSYFTAEDEKNIEEIDGVNKAERRVGVEGKAVFLDKQNLDLEGNSEPYMRFTFLDTQEISQMKIVSGEPYEADREGIWVDDRFAEYYNLAVGDVLTVKINNCMMQEVIKGTILHPEYVYYNSDTREMVPPYGTFGYAFLSAKEYPLPGSHSYTEIIVDTNTVKNQDTIKAQIRKIIDNENAVISDRTQEESFSTFDAEVAQHKMMGFLFPVVFLLIALLGIMTTMTRMTANQRIQIGTLKALGFSKGRIIRHYLSYGFFISLIGAVIGGIVGYFTLPHLIMASMSKMYILPAWKTVISWNSYYAIGAEVAVSTIVSYLACRKELMDPPALTLKPKSPKRIAHTALEKSKLWLRLTFQTQWNIRDVLRNKSRSLMGIIGVSGCTMLLLCAFGCRDSVGHMATWMYDEIMISNHCILLEKGTRQGDAEEYAKKYAGQMIEEEAIEIQANDILKTGTLTVVDQGNYLHIQNPALREIPLDKKGITLSSKMATLLQVQIGDYIKWHVMGEDTWQYTRIVSINRVPSGQGITITRQAYEALSCEFKANKILTNMSLPDDITDDSKVQTIQEVRQLKSEMNKSMEMMNIMVAILIVAAVVLGVVVLYNLGVLSFVEKTREIATLKVLGFPSRKIQGILQMQNVWITTIGILIGIPLGYLFLAMICQSLSERDDLYPCITTISYVLSVIGTFAVSILVNAMLSGKVKTIDMVDALKGVE